jgi:hypothetical protein
MQISKIFLTGAALSATIILSCKKDADTLLRSAEDAASTEAHESGGGRGNL